MYLATLNNAHVMSLPQESTPGQGDGMAFLPPGNILYYNKSDQETLFHKLPPTPGEIVNYAPFYNLPGRPGGQPLGQANDIK